MTLEHEQQLENEYVMPTFVRKPVEFVSGSGMELVDDKGKTYLDFIGGIGVIAIGHCNPVLADALAEQAHKLMHVSNYYYVEGRGDLSKKLCDMLNHGAAEPEVWKTFYTNSGAESNECAVKIARLHAKKNGRGGTIVTLEGSFHGRTLATLAATAQPAKQEAFQPLPAGFVATPPNDVAALEALFEAQGTDIAAVLVEPIQGEGGVKPLTQEFMQAVREQCTKHGALMMCDEVQTGIYRCGTPYAFQKFGVVPDVVSMAKGIGGGMPMGACAARGEIADTFSPGDHGTTFGGSCMAITAANTTLDYIQKHDIAANVEETGAYLREQLATLPHMKEVRGMGLMDAIEFDDTVDAPALVLAALEADQGLVLNYTGPHTMRFLPPLVCTKADVDVMIAQMKELLG
ncbi:aspartate aminotransferase family protein [Slackia heliotrinireducens]|uniref:aspartate aminotransferase family protein n=1 Tax=Slackia heliotrinireducens TaxID=84110 RepID=UPI003315E6C3